MIVVTSESFTSTEVRLIGAHHPLSAARVVEPRQADHEYQVEPGGDVLYVRTNSGGRNFRLVRAPLATPDGAHQVARVVPRAPRVAGKTPPRWIRPCR